MFALMICAMVEAGRTPEPHSATPAVWDVNVPKSCYGRALVFTGGKSALNNVPIQDFLKLKSQIEACGGSVSLEMKAGN